MPPPAEGESFEDARATAEAAGASLPASQLPWQQIPSFDAQTTDIQVYSRKLQFLRSIWPSEYISQLAPRAALQVQGVAFQKVARLDASRLRSENGAQYLVEALGGQWGRLASEEKLALFEKALYQTMQRSDETNDSYLARHDVAFEDLMSHKVTLEEVRAYVLLRQSQVSSDDRKRIIMDVKGELTYAEARKALRLLGARFFQELQGNAKNSKYKTYDINTADNVPEATAMMATEGEPQDDWVFQALYDEGDEDAAFIHDFEETLIETVQESPELASCYATYLEARTRLKERAKFRGFWSSGSNGKGKGGGKKGKGKGFKKSMSLADRIANSECKRCFQIGHWKRECPLLNQSKPETKPKAAAETISIAEALMAEPEEEIHGEDREHDVTEIVDELPEGATELGLTVQNVSNGSLVEFIPNLSCHQEVVGPQTVDCDEVFLGELKQQLGMKSKEFQTSMKTGLMNCCRKYGHLMPSPTSLTAAPTPAFEPEDQKVVFSSPASVFLTEESAGEAVIDTGASRSVIGAERVEGLIQAISGGLRTAVKQVASAVNFRFGNSGTLQSLYALCIPRQQKGWIRVEVVPGRTPFLISNSIMRDLGVLIDPRNCLLRFLHDPGTIPLKRCRKNLLCVSVTDLLGIHEPGKQVEDEIFHQEDKEMKTNMKDSETRETKPMSNIPPRINMNTQTDAVVQPLTPCTELSNSVRVERSSTHSELPSTPACDSTFLRSHGQSKRLDIVSRARTLGRRGCGSADQADLHDQPRLQSVPDSSGHQDLEPMGSSDHSIREEPRSLLCGGLREGSGIHLPDPQQESSGILASKPSELYHGPREVPDSSSDSHTSGDIGVCGSPQDQPQAEEVHRESEERGMADDLRGTHAIQSNIEQERPQSQPDRTTDNHDHDSRSRESSTAADTDRSAPARIGSRDKGARRCVKNHPALLSDDQVSDLHKRVSDFIGVIENDLSQIKQRSIVVRAPKPTNQSRPVLLLEVYCEQESQLTQQIRKQGGIALRFTKMHGDLSTPEGVNKLWSWIYLYEPEHVWVAPECKFWGAFSRFNMGRGITTQNMILDGRKRDLKHLELCNQIYLHQVAAGRHFHLEQPIGSDMIKQPQLQDVHTGTLPAFFDMCRAGKLKSPNKETYLKKRTQVLTTSRFVHQMLHNQNCQHDHKHTPIQGSMQDETHKWKKLSTYAASYTAVFAKKVIVGIVQSVVHGEPPLIMEELLVGESVEKGRKRPVAQEVLELRKCRRRHGTKSPPFPEEADRYPPREDWKEIFTSFEKSVPRVGNAYFDFTDERVERLQNKFPQVEIRLVIICRGTERYRVPKPDIPRDDIPLRKTVLVCRDNGHIKDMGDFEEWQHLSKLKQSRKAHPAKISMSVFARYRQSSGSGLVRSTESDAPMELPQSMSVSVPPSSMAVPAISPNLSEESQESHPIEDEPIQGWPPRIIPRHGPAFKALTPVQKADLQRLHHNLGHPDPARLQRMLQDQGADPQIVQGALDMQCDVCLETQKKPKLPHLSAIHDDLDFNDVVGADGAHWKAQNGQTYHFMHFIDEGTLFHLGAPSGRTVEEQIRTFEDVWLHWAGPCKTLYLDPAGEYVSPKWNDRLQQENIKVFMAAGDSHWQIGRAEIHGRIIKDMLTRMDHTCPIKDGEDFRKCLRQAFAAKNSLSRVKGFTPEQALLGKARSLPASLTADTNSGAHLLAESQLPEGLKFRESLQRREQARKAFVEADNDSACRRALLRRSRPGSVEFEAGDWVLYWKRVRGNIRHERGRWYGPAQVITVDQKKVIWVCHGGYLIRASPQHLRPASMREYQALPRDSHGNVRDEEISSRTRNFVSLDEDPPDEDLYSPSVIQTPSMDVDSEQPENEISPPASQMFDTSEPDNPDVEMPPVPGDLGGLSIPVPDSDEEMHETMFSFGDDCESPLTETGLWEITLTEASEFSHAEDVVDGNLAECILIASTAKKQRVEVQWRTLNDTDQALFRKAKEKEVNAWIDHGTVKRLAKGTLPENRIMRCRWILTWKDPLPGTDEKRAKARLVILGFEDPDISTVPNDAPTLSKDGKQLLLQKIASQKWDLLNFDVSTAFLKGVGDGRPLGIHAPAEISQALGMKQGEQCGLEGGAYGRIDAPYLWYVSFKETLESLGFVVCPLDGCLFSLVTQDSNGRPQVRGVLGVHVDDGIGGGDSYFRAIIEKLREKYSFGAFNIGEFDSCGIHYRQWRDGSIELNQQKYIERIDPIQICRHRRKEPQAPVTEPERQCLRQLCGSLQYAAVQTRPDISAKVGILQSAIPKACIEHLLEANRVLFETKRNPVNLVVVPIPEKQVSFCAFSDASFETKKGSASRQGTIIFTTDSNMAQNQLAVICPIAWSSRKIPRVVRSTLSAEASALSGTLDRLGWLRILWAWMLDPSIDWTNPNEVLKKSPLASIATDCKSVYDLSTKTSTPVCEGFRTTLECLLIRERLTENCRLRWVCSQAMLADCLTKVMDGGTLRKALELKKYALFDELDILRQRADKRERLKWLSEQAKTSECSSEDLMKISETKVLKS